MKRVAQKGNNTEIVASETKVRIIDYYCSLTSRRSCSSHLDIIDDMLAETAHLAQSCIMGIR